VQDVQPVAVSTVVLQARTVPLTGEFTGRTDSQSTVELRASDIHLEPGLNDVQVRLRVDGVLRHYVQLPKWLQPAVVSRLKILAKLEAAERLTAVITEALRNEAISYRRTRV